MNLDWMSDGACRGRTDAWLMDKADRPKAALALHHCLKHCDVLDKCRLWALERHAEDRWQSVVVGGIHFGHDTEPVDTAPRDCGTCEAGGRVAHDRQCVECGGPMPIRASAGELRCGRACRARSQARSGRESYHRKVSGVRKACLVCGQLLPEGSRGNRKACPGICETQRRRWRNRNAMANRRQELAA